jgi:hypothetical protein
MHSTLCDAVARCHLRRVRGVAAGAPLPAAIVALVLLTAPVMLLRLGGAVGAELAGGIGNAGVSDAVVLGPVLAAAVAGSALAVAAPTRAALGAQVGAGPPGPVAAVIALTLVPALAGSIVIVPALVALCIGLARSLPGGAIAGVALAAATLAAVPAGAVVAEGVIAVGRGQHRRALALGIAVPAWIALGVSLGAAPLGPLALVASAVSDTGSPWLALGAAVGVGIGLATAWLALAASRAEPRSRRRAAGRAGRRRLPAAIAASILLARRSDLRFATMGAATFGLAGAVLAAAGDAPPPAPFLLGATTALLGSVLCPLVVGGVVDQGRWLWRSAPVRSGAIARAFTLASTATAALPVAVVGSAAAVASGAGARIIGVVATLVLSGSCVALLAGALLPWRGAGAGDQLTTIAALAALAIAASFVVALVAPRLVALGMPDPAVVVAMCLAFLAAALGALDRRLGAGG